MIFADGSFHMMNWMLGILFSSGAAFIAYWRRMLSRSGAVAAVVIGTCLFALGSPSWYVTLLVFFFSSSLLSKWKQKRKAEAEEMYEKGSARDGGQVLANGGIAVMACIGFATNPSPIFIAAYLGAVATVTGDTWATEIGSLSSSPPRHMIYFHKVVPGTSGGISILGSLAACAGTILIGLTFWSIFSWESANDDGFFWMLSAAVIGGMAGVFTDSLLGAVLQRKYCCSVCGKIVEKRIHCDQPAPYYSGFRMIGNDAVNFVSSLTGSGVAMICFFLTT